jgi:predicted nucleotide-binding protein
MSEQLVHKFEELIAAGTQLAPLGGFDFSGYNARLQNKYLEWRKLCLETLESSGPIGFTYKQKILGDANGGFFFQNSAQLILNSIKELYEKLKLSPDLAAAAQPVTATTSASAASNESGGVRTLKPPPKKAATQEIPSQPQPASAPTQTQAPLSSPPVASQSNKVYVIGEESDPLRAELLQFLVEIGLLPVEIERQHGQMLALDSVQDRAEVKYAFFVINTDDLAYAMFEIGHFVGKLGKNRVCVIHMSDVSFPKNVPGVVTKPIVVKLEEANFSIMKELKALGFQINL